MNRAISLHLVKNFLGTIMTYTQPSQEVFGTNLSGENGGWWLEDNVSGEEDQSDDGL